MLDYIWSQCSVLQLLRSDAERAERDKNQLGITSTGLEHERRLKNSQIAR
jgi:hypothetical protein